jgi:hypothetical protein
MPRAARARRAGPGGKGVAPRPARPWACIGELECKWGGREGWRARDGGGWADAANPHPTPDQPAPPPAAAPTDDAPGPAPPPPDDAAPLLELEREAEEEARGETVALTVGAALALGAAFWAFRGPEIAGQYFAGYLLEQSLSVDNLFVFVLVFRCAVFG